MKTFKLFLLLIAVFSFVTCDLPIALGELLDVYGPVVEFTSPVPRKTVGAVFDITGTVSDPSGVRNMLLIAMMDGVRFPKQWSYQDGQWHISEDSGATWALYSSAEYNGTVTHGSWKVPIDMKIGTTDPSDGQYIFSIQTWDVAGYSDANSFKTLMLIIDNNPPIVSVSNPMLLDSAESSALFAKTDWKSPELIGSYQTQSFLMQWQIEENFDVWSFDLRFYPDNTVVDGIPYTSLPTSYYYRYVKNLPPPPDGTQDPNSSDILNPNGSVKVPDLSNPKGTYGENGEINDPITAKTRVKVVAICYDSAGNTKHEKELGYFVYWPQADGAWIDYANDEMKPLKSWGTGGTTNPTENQLEGSLMIHPGRTIRANSFHYHGLKEVRYTLYEYNPTSQAEPALLTGAEAAEYTNRVITNTPNSKGVYPTGMAWSFTPPKRSGVFVLRAEAFGINENFPLGKPGGIYEAVFRVQDITFPDFTIPIEPPATDPLYMHIKGTTPATNYITIKGQVSDATDVDSVCLVWINPVSRDAAANAQLEYFKNPNYAGWITAKSLATTNANGAIESNFDSANPNRVWKLPLTPAGEDPETRRKLFNFERNINLSLLNIAPDNQPLRSQMFLLRVENKPGGKTTIITYAPKGDAESPKIEFTNIQVTRAAGGPVETYTPGQVVEIPMFYDGDIIRVNGTWEEDSIGNGTAAYLNPDTWLYSNIVFKINEKVISQNPAVNTTRSVTRTNSVSKTGTFQFSATLGSGSHYIQTSTMRDALVVSADIKDSGGNPSEDGASWLIQSDKLRLIRVSSENTDKAYKAGDKIEIFMEFNKPVQLVNAGSNPRLVLNTTPQRTADYNAATSNTAYENTLQFFGYTVTQGDIAANLDVTGLLGGDTGWNLDGYAFAFKHTNVSGMTEQIRITNPDPSPVRTPAAGANYTTHKLPIGTSAGGQDIYSLYKSKNIEIDTNKPIPQSITATPSGWHSTGDIYITVEFNKHIKPGTGADAPYLTLNTGGTSPADRTDTSNVRFSNNAVTGRGTMTFIYTIKSTDNTYTSTVNTLGALQVTGFGGKIYDIPGNEVETFTNLTEAQRTIAGVYIDTTRPAAPTLNARAGNGDVIITNNVNSLSVDGTSNGVGLEKWTPGDPPPGANIFNLGSLYLDSWNIQIAPNNSIANRDLARIEYSTDYGKTWNVYTSVIYSSSLPAGTFQLTSRQIDRAGNESQWSKPVVFEWDKGEIVQSINSSTPNQTYTNNDNRQDVIEITAHLRKPVRFNAVPRIVLNASNTSGAVRVNADYNTAIKPLVSEITFNYAVGTGDNTAGARLNVTGFENIDVMDRYDVNVGDFFNLPASANNLGTLKAIYVQTGALERVNPAPAFTTGTVNADESYNTTLQINFNRALKEGSGTGVIEVIQTAATFRIPAVLSETQYNMYRSAGITSLDDFYKVGTNGLTSAGAVDTSRKYVLVFSEDTTSITPSATGTDIQKLAEEMRQAEKITINSNAQAVTLATNNSIANSRLVITFSGSNALKVPGGTYTVTLPKGFKQDDLAYDTPLYSGDLAIGGIAKPFIRVNKPQETITTPGTANRPRIEPTFSLSTQVKMDTRTPGATIRWNRTENLTNVTGTNWDSSGPYDNDTRPAQPTAPTSTSTSYTSGTPVSIGNGTNEVYQGYIWRVRAIAFVGTAASASSEEMAFRTVLTYKITNMAAPSDQNQQRMNQKGDGEGADQIWIRGGTDINISNVPGFPLTWNPANSEWEDVKANKKRAGIRLLELTSGTSASYNQNSTWKWVTWDISVPAYIDIVMGRDNVSSAQVLTQYGPLQWANQRDWWTSMNREYRLYPGKHRWLDTEYNPGGGVGGVLNFEATFKARPGYSNTDVTYP